MRPICGCSTCKSYSPGLEAIETVGIVTNSFDADQGMAGGASVNVQVKSDTDTLTARVRYPDGREPSRPATIPST